MREIKFRAWDIESKKWLSHRETIELVNEWNGSFEIDGFIIVQFVGLKDKNGKEIYDGDVVSYDGKGSEVVEYEDGCFWVGLNGELPAPLYAQMGIESMQVIGNVFESPNLLKDNS